MAQSDMVRHDQVIAVDIITRAKGAETFTADVTNV